MRRKFILLLILSFGAIFVQAGDDAVLNWASSIGGNVRVVPNLVYKRANNFDCKLDVYAFLKPEDSRPTVIYFHGGGWTGSSKEQYSLVILPYLAMGMNVVNVEYRLGPVSLAPAAVEDCRCALRWVYQHANEYRFDTGKLVLAGLSAGGHLALITGMLSPDSGFDNECFGDEHLKVAAILNYYGVTDVADVLEGPNRKSYTPLWFGARPDRFELARQLSPVNHVRGGLPPVLTIHGNKDPAVPYEHAVRLHKALDEAGVRNRLLTIDGAGHGGFNPQQTMEVQDAVKAFLQDLGVIPQN